MKEKAQKHITVGNVTYMWGRPDNGYPASSHQRRSAGTGELDADEQTTDLLSEDFSLEEQTAIRRLESSLSGTWTPGRLKTKITSLGFSGEKAERIFRHIVRSDSYDTLWVATREVGRRLKKGQGEQRLQMELKAAGFDDAVISQALQAVSEDEWHEALDIAMQSSSIRSKEGPALKQALARRGFSSSRIQSFLKQRQENV